MIRPSFSRPPRLLVALSIAAAPVFASPQQPSVSVPDRSGAPIAGVDADRGSGTSRAIDRFDDDVPLPITRRTRAGAQGDEILAPAAGDPFFLGFAAGPFHPPAVERWDEQWLASMLARPADPRPRNEVYAFAMMAKRITPQRVAELEQLGARVLGFHPHHALKVAIPATALPQVANHPDVRWVGPARAWQKIHPVLASEIAGAREGDVLDVWVNVFESDLETDAVRMPGSLGSMFAADPGGQPVPIGNAEEALRRTMTIRSTGGWQQAALESMGLAIDEYVEEIRAFRARATRTQIEALAARDFVLFVEAQRTPRLFHDETAPMVYADSVRGNWTGGSNQVAIAGVIDSGALFTHPALAGHFVIGASTTTSFATDGCGHGSHVAGTIFGNPPAPNQAYAGMAPQLGWGATGRIRIVKAFADNCADAGSSAVGVYQFMRGTIADSTGNLSPKPHVINCSYGAAPGGTPWVGTEAFSRFLDQEIMTEQQLYVFAAGNFGAGGGTIGDPAVAKNVLTVGAVDNVGGLATGPGAVSSFSSRGPCGDGRWKPNLVAPGNPVRSVNANGVISGSPSCTARVSGYLDCQGTSMAAPHVTGMAGLAADALPWMRYAPERFAAHAMATADRRGVTALSTASDPFLDEYGAGRINAHKFHYGAATWFTANWAHTQALGSYYFADFNVPSGASELVLVMTYHEDAASAGASRALVNDLDLWLDLEPFDPAGNAGEWFAHQSNIDNTEIRVIPNPTPGNYRWKTYPRSAIGTPRVSVSAFAVLRPTTQPALQTSASASATVVRGGQEFDLDVQVGTSTYQASAVDLTLWRPPGTTITSATTTLTDGRQVNLANNSQGGFGLVLGDIHEGYPRTVRYRVALNQEGFHFIGAAARSENGGSDIPTTTVTCDSTPPGTVSNLDSPTHPSGTWVASSNVQLTWNYAQDNLSGVAGYGYAVNATAPCTVMIPNRNFENLTLPSGGHTFSIRALDLAANCGNAVTRDVYVDVDPPQGLAFLGSSHPVNTWSASTGVVVIWQAATDLHSGLAGYVIGADHSPSTIASGAVNLPNWLTVSSFTLSGSGQPWYVHLAARDYVGNLGTTVHWGPFYIDGTAPSATLSINGGNASTSSNAVTLAIGATDPEAPITRMRFRNDNGNFSPWESFAPTKSWNLTDFGGWTQTGTRTVEVEVENQAGLIGGATDTIYRYVPSFNFGTACAGSFGNPTFAVQGEPGIGRTVQLVTGNTAAPTLAVYFGLSRTTWLGLPLPFDLAPFGLGGCFANISLDLSLYTGPRAALPIALPGDPMLIGFEAFFQGLLLGDPSGRPLVTTRGVSMTIAGA